MRQIGVLQSESEAVRFAAYLVTRGIHSQVELAGADFLIWVRDENHAAEAKQLFAEYRLAPNDPKYADAQRQAIEKLREEERRRRQAQKNLVDMNDRWRAPGQGAAFTVALIVLSVVVALASNFGNSMRPVAGHLAYAAIREAEDGSRFVPVDFNAQLKQGQAWRLFTPVFLHFGVVHLAFNMLVLFYFGRQIESARGAWFLAGLVAACAIPSNVAQVSWTGNPVFGGMSGVNYGLFGYVWMVTLFRPDSSYRVGEFTTFLFLGFLFGGILLSLPALRDTAAGQAVSQVAHIAHGVGLLVGVACGATPFLGRGARRG